MNYENMGGLRLLPTGVHLSIDLDALIARVMIAPEAPAWFTEPVRDVVAKYGQSFDVDASLMSRRPRYGFI